MQQSLKMRTSIDLKYDVQGLYRERERRIYVTLNKGQESHREKKKKGSVNEEFIPNSG